MPTTGWCDSAKQELLQAGHCFNATVSVNFSGVSGQFALTGGSSTAGIAVGMAVTGTNIAAGAVVASVDSQSQVTLSKPHTGTITAQSITFTADTFKILLIKVGPGGTYDHTLVNVGTPGSGSASTTNVGTDEVTGAGYTSGGFALSNVAPALSSTTATTSFSVNPNWTSATISTIAAVISNSSAARNGGAATANIGNRAISVHDFGGTQTVTAGTLTLVMPTNNSSSAILRAG